MSTNSSWLPLALQKLIGCYVGVMLVCKSHRSFDRASTLSMHNENGQWQCNVCTDPQMGTPYMTPLRVVGTSILVGPLSQTNVQVTTSKGVKYAIISQHVVRVISNGFTNAINELGLVDDPGAIACSHDDYMHVYDRQRGQVCVFNVAGSLADLTRTYGEGELFDARSIAINAKSEAFVLDYHGIKVFNDKQLVRSIACKSGSADSIVIDSDGKLYVYHSDGRLQVRTVDGELLATLRLPSLSSPTLAIDSHNRLYVLSSKGHFLVFSVCC